MNVQILAIVIPATAAILTAAIGAVVTVSGRKRERRVGEIYEAFDERGQLVVALRENREEQDRKIKDQDAKIDGYEDRINRLEERNKYFEERDKTCQEEVQALRDDFTALNESLALPKRKPRARKSTSGVKRTTEG